MYEVQLSHSPNPDIDGGYWDYVPEEPARSVTVDSLLDAARACMDYIRRNDLGGGNWTGGKISQNGEQVARVSYNGRVWDMNRAEIDVWPAGE